MIFLRALAVWLLLLLVESGHGIFRRAVLEPWIGDLSSRQICVFTGSALILILTYLFIDWVRAGNARQLMLIGMMWVVLTIAFEVGIGRMLLDYSWDRVLSDFNPAKGGLLGIGLFIMGLAPKITARLRARKGSLERAT